MVWRWGTTRYHLSENKGFHELINRQSRNNNISRDGDDDNDALVADVDDDNAYLSDLTSGLVTVLTEIIWKTTVEWHAGTTGCKIVRYLQVNHHFYISTYLWTSDWDWVFEYVCAFLCVFVCVCVCVYLYLCVRWFVYVLSCMCASTRPCLLAHVE